MAKPTPPLATSELPGHPAARIWVGDCRKRLLDIPEVAGKGVDLVFADPPFNWNRAYDKWQDDMPRDDYLRFTYDWLDLCADALKPGGAFWVNIPDDSAAEIVMHLKGIGLDMVNWCIWHYRFGQNTRTKFINSKVHALYFVKPPVEQRVWNPEPVLEISDRRAIYGDARTESKKDGMPAGMRVPMDVWYGPYWGRIQGNNKERCPGHDNQLPEAYLERVILCSSNPGDVVLDPFTGSGTTGVVARQHGRVFVGTEFSRENAKRARARIERGMTRTGVREPVSTAISPQRVTPLAERAERAGQVQRKQRAAST